MLNDQETAQFDFSKCSPARPEELTPGMFLGKEKNYRLEKFLGAGGMGHVWLAAEMEDGVELRKVVCKILPVLIQREKKEMEKVLKTFHLVQPLNHPNICPIYSLRSDPVYGYFFVIGYADGGSLWDWFQEQPDYANGLSVSQVVEVLHPIAQALDYAHEMGIMHRDVKPQNILFVTRKGRKIPWLIDFGISAQIHSTTTQTLGDRCSRSTPAYMAPEQCQSRLQDGRTDQYALGVLAYQLLSGRLPFEADNLMALMNRIVYEPVPALTNVSAQVNAAVRRAMAKDLKDRFASCEEFIEALAGEKSFKPSLWSVVRPIVKALKKYQWPLIAGVLALLVIWFSLFIPSTKPIQPGPVEVVPPVALDVQSTEPVANTVEDGLSAGTRRVLTADGIEYAFRWCPPGEFMMGGETINYASMPVHKVTLTKGFWLLETEVTQEMWQSVMGSNPSGFKDDKNPVEFVSWEDSCEFCRKLSEKLNQTIQLPTEAQWEYACRAGTTGNSDGNLEEMSWYNNNSESRTHLVGLKKTNPWGLYDMHGNVWEHCLDYMNSFTSFPETDPTGPKTGYFHIVRGGGWELSTDFCLSFYRGWVPSDYKKNDCGFRVLMVPEEESSNPTQTKSSGTQLQATSRDSFEWDGTAIEKFIGSERDVVIPEGVTEICGQAFDGCSSLMTIVIPEGVRTIKRSAFKGCSSLKSIVIPDSVTAIDANAFEKCPNLTIHAPAGSKAEKYANANGIPFETK